MNNDQSITPRIVVFGANGGIGRQTVEQALHRGYTVTAVVRNPESLPVIHPGLMIQKADVMRPETLMGIFQPTDAVISAIGSNSTKQTTLYSQGDRNIMKAMAHAGASRFIAISAAGLEVNPTHNLLIRWFTKNILQRILKHMYADLWRMEHIVKASELNWTIVRPPRLTDGPRRGNYRISIGAFVKNGKQIARADVADFVLNNVSNKDIFRETVELAY